MQRDGGGERRRDPLARPAPAVQHPCARIEVRGGRRRPDALDIAAKRVGECLYQAGDCLEQRPVGHHRRDDRAHPGLRVPLRRRLDAFRRHHRELEEQVVACGASLADHLERVDQRGEVLVPGRLVHGEPGPGIEQELQRPPVAQPLAERAVAVGMRIDETRHDQPARGIDDRSVFRRRQSGRSDCIDRAVANEDVRGLGATLADVEHPPAPYDGRRGLSRPGHGASATAAPAAAGSSTAAK